MKKFNIKQVVLLAILPFILIILIFTADYLLQKYYFQQEIIFSGLNEFFLTDTDINEYHTENQDSVDIFHYYLQIDIHSSEKTIGAVAKITAYPVYGFLKKIDLNLRDNLTLNKVDINNKPVKYEHSGSLLRLFAGEVLKDTFEIKISYGGEPLSIGASSFNFKEYNNQPAIYTINEPTYASTWFPCIDRPDDKALLDIEITNDSSLVSISNGNLVEVKTKENRKTYHWKTVYPLSTYLICFYSGDYAHFSDRFISSGADTMNIDYYVYPDLFEKAKIDFNEHLEMLQIFTNLFGEYPFLKEKYGVATFLWQAGAIEHQTITGIGSEMIGGNHFFRDIYVHELAHQWWGNAVGPKTWKDVWLNEGFATYSEILFYEKAIGAGIAGSLMEQKKIFPEDRLYAPEGILFSETVYNKGAWVLHMLRKEIGETKFLRVLRNYFEKYKYKNASTNDFKNICETESGKDLLKFFDQWVYDEKAIPVIEYEWQAVQQENKIKVNLTLEQIQDSDKPFHLPIDLQWVFKDSTEINLIAEFNSKDTVLNFTFDKMPVNIIIDPDNWLLAEINLK